MKRVLSRRFKVDFLELPESLQRLTLRKLELLEDNLAHPSLRVKKMKGVGDVYEGSINMSYRFILKLTASAWYCCA